MEVCVFVCVKERGQLAVHLGFLTGSFPGTWDLLVARLAGQQTPGILCLCLADTGIIMSVHCHTPVFHG